MMSRCREAFSLACSQAFRQDWSPRGP